MQTEDLTKGAMATHFRTLAIPAALGMLFATLYTVVDVYWAGRLSTDAQAGLAIGYQAFFVLMAIWTWAGLNDSRQFGLANFSRLKQFR